MGNRLNRCLTRLTGAALLAALAAMLPAAPQTAGDDEALIGLPPGADAIGCLSLRNARNDPAFPGKLDRTLALFGAEVGQSVVRFERRTRIDVNKDLDTVAFAMRYPPPGARNAEPSFAVIARGRFDKEAIARGAEQMAAENGATVERRSQDGALELVFTERRPAGAPAGASEHLAFPRDGEMVFATTTELFRQTQRALKARTAAAADPAYNALLRGVDRGALFWAAGDVPRELRAMAVAPPAAGKAGAGPAAQPAASQAERFGFVVDTAQGLRAELTVVFSDAAGAQAAQNQLNMYRSLASLALMTNDGMPPESRAAVNAVLQQVAVSASGTSARAALNLNPVEYDALFAALEHAQGAKQPSAPRTKRAPGRPSR